MHSSNFSSSNGSTEDLFRDSIDSCDNDITEKVGLGGRRLGWSAAPGGLLPGDKGGLSLPRSWLSGPVTWHIRPTPTPPNRTLLSVHRPAGPGRQSCGSQVLSSVDLKVFSTPTPAPTTVGELPGKEGDRAGK